MVPSPDDLVARLRAAGSVFAEDEARLLCESARSAAELTVMAERRVAGVPLEVVVGWADFCGRRVIVEPGVFVPRTRSGVLVEEGARLIRPGAVVVDLCCGSGAVGLALLDVVEGLRMYASDVDPSAVWCARRNLEPLGAEVSQGDLFAALPRDIKGSVDLLVVNAPYVPTASIATMPSDARNHEPSVALDGGPDGLRVHRRVAAGAGEWLAPDGHLIVETSARQAAGTAAAMADRGLVPRVVVASHLDGTAVVGRLPRGSSTGSGSVPADVSVTPDTMLVCPP